MGEGSGRRKRHEVKLDRPIPMGHEDKDEADVRRGLSCRRLAVSPLACRLSPVASHTASPRGVCGWAAGLLCCCRKYLGSAGLGAWGQALFGQPPGQAQPSNGQL